jgi:cell division protein FtsL
MRLLNLASLCFAIASALFLYALNYDTRQLEVSVQALERDAQSVRNNIAVLKAERSHLARPERIDPLARHLGLAPPDPAQFISPDDQALAARDDVPAIRQGSAHAQ